MSDVTRVDVLGVPVTPCTTDEAVERVAEWIRSGERHFATFTGVHGVMESQKDPEVLRAHQHAEMIACDGAPIVWASRFAGANIRRRVTGREFMRACLERAGREGWTSYFYGGKPGVVDAIRSALSDSVPDLKIAGSFSPPFRAMSAEEDRAAIDAINASNADLVWVGLSTPKQELWMAKHRHELHAPALFGVGAAFDYLAGELREAPRWMQRTGFEWLYRVILEPRRLAGRYLRSNPAFIRAVAQNRPKLLDGTHT